MKTRYDLSPTDGRKSFYGKTYFIYDNATGTSTLYSYDTPTIKRLADGTMFRLWFGWSATTGRHIAAFCGLNKAGFLALPGEITTGTAAAEIA